MTLTLALTLAFAMDNETIPVQRVYGFHGNK